MILTATIFGPLIVAFTLFAVLVIFKKLKTSIFASGDYGFPKMEQEEAHFPKRVTPTRRSMRHHVLGSVRGNSPQRGSRMTGGYRK